MPREIDPISVSNGTDGCRNEGCGQRRTAGRPNRMRAMPAPSDNVARLAQEPDEADAARDNTGGPAK